MAAFTTIALAVGAAASVAGTVASYSQQKKASKLSQQQQAVATRKSRRQGIREAQIRRAQSIASAQGAGGLQSSAAAGGIGSLGSQLGAELGFSTQMSNLSRDIGTARSKAEMFGGIAQLGALGYQYGSAAGATFGGGNKPTSPAASGQGAKNFGSAFYGNSAYVDSF